MSNDIAIRVSGLSKRYYIGGKQERYRTLRDTLTDAFVAPFRKAGKLLRGHATGAAGLHEAIWALKDISFEVKQGEVIGIIGRNGAGKSTLLKIISRITEPTEGYADIYGRVGSLLEVGTGFHPELTGRENIYLNGAILGMKRVEIDQKFDEIVSFAEVEKFIDTPVKHYSSGMYLRLAFAVAAHLEPEILLVDEVLAVGDAQFQNKCLGKMEDVAKEGRTVLFVSHNMAAIQRLCSRAIILDQGMISRDGEARNVVISYISGITDSKSEQTIEKRRPKAIGQAGYFVSWSVGPSLDEKYTVMSGKDIVVELEAKFNKFVKNAYFGIALWSDEGTLIWAANSHDGRDKITFETGEYAIQFIIKHFILRPGAYWVEVSINSAEGQLDRWYAYPNLTVKPDKPTVLPANWQGMINFDYKFSVSSKN